MLDSIKVAPIRERWHLETFQGLEPSRQKDQSQVSGANRRKPEKQPEQGPHRTYCCLADSSTLSMGMSTVPKQGYARKLHPGFSIETVKKKPTSATNDLGLYRADSCPPVVDKDYLDNSVICPGCQQVKTVGCLPHQTRKPSPSSMHWAQLHSY